MSISSDFLFIRFFICYVWHFQKICRRNVWRNDVTVVFCLFNIVLNHRSSFVFRSRWWQSAQTCWRWQYFTRPVKQAPISQWEVVKGSGCRSAMADLTQGSSLREKISRASCPDVSSAWQGVASAVLSRFVELLLLMNVKLRIGPILDIVLPTREQKRFAVLEMVADWHQLMIPRRTMRPSIACLSEQSDPRSAASRHTTDQINNSRLPSLSS